MDFLVVKNSSDFSVVFKKRFLWTSAAVPGSIVAKGKGQKLSYKERSHTMESVISKLYNGEIFPVENGISADEKYRLCVDKVGRAIEELEEILTGEQYKKLENMIDMNAEVVKLENKAIYAEGVRFGVELMIEINRLSENAKH